MSQTRLSRRHLLRGAVGGAFVSVALPPLEAMLNGNGEAFANGAPIPKRFASWFWAQGAKRDAWIPRATGTAWHAAPPPALRPFAERDLLKYVSVVTRSWVPFKVFSPPHFSNEKTILSASPLRILSGPDSNGNYRSEMTGPSILDVIKQKLAGATKFDQVLFTVSRAWTSSSKLQGTPTSVDHNPQALFDRLFAGLTAPTGQVVSPSSGLVNARKSLLDAVAADAADVRKRLGAVDQRRLDEHLEGVRSLERSLTFASAAPVCTLPTRPGLRPPDDGMRERLEEINASMTELVTYAFACDLTRFARLHFMRPQSNIIFWPVDVLGEYHELGHSERSPQPGVQRSVEFMMKQLAILVDRLRSVPVGDKTLLDHTCLWAWSEVNDPQKHGLYNLPNLLIGRAGGALKGGIHHDAAGVEADLTAVPSAVHTRLLLTIMRALGITQPSFGNAEGQTDMSLRELEA